MNFLIPRLHPIDRFLAWAALNQGHEIVTVGSMLPPDHWFCLGDKVYSYQIASHKASGMNAEEYVHWYGEQLDGYVRTHNIDAILPSAATDMIIEQIGIINNRYHMPGISPMDARLFSDKNMYMSLLRESGIDVPMLHEIVPPGQVAMNLDIDFPVICKPVKGTGSKGIYISNSKENHQWFFGPSDRPQDFNEDAAAVHDRLLDGSLRNYLYHGEGGAYMVEELVNGECISLGGVVKDGELEINCIHEVDVTPLPYRAETGFSFSHQEVTRELKESAERLANLLAELLPFPDGAWRADCIWNGKRLTVVDVAPRMCTTASRALASATKMPTDYSTAILSCFLGFTHKEIQLKNIAVRCKVLGLPKCKVKEVIKPKYAAMVDEFEGPSTYIFEARNDLQSWNRGWVLATGDTLADAEDTVEKFLDELVVITE